jgi:hypothetical protein
MQYQASGSIQDKMNSPCWVCYKEVFFLIVGLNALQCHMGHLHLAAPPPMFQTLRIRKHPPGHLVGSTLLPPMFQTL